MRILLSIALLVSSFIGYSADNTFYNDLVEKGNAAYEAEQYDSAITLYSQTVNANFQSTSLFFNLGNAYYKSNQLAPAIFYYEKALKLSPNSPDIKFNLKMANSQITDKVAEKPVPISTQVYQSVSSLLSSNGWGILVLVLLTLALGFLAVYLISANSSIKQLSFFGAMGLFLLFLLSFALGNRVKAELITKDQGIVFTSTLNVKSEPKLSSSVLFVIHEGTKVNVLETQQDWHRIALPDGNEGWVQSVDIQSF
ncbi:MAG: tetratricopeptide repeat protein [Salibacteraceae bacterium]